MNTISYRGGHVTEDTAEALRLLELRLAEIPGARLHAQGVAPQHRCWAAVAEHPGPTNIMDPIQSMRPTGREVYLRLSIDGGADNLTALWAAAIPCGFAPYTRHPAPGVGAAVFHYFGPWARMVESLWATGQGEYAWVSLCCAGQLEVGSWEGDRQAERAVQAHLHLQGYPCGPVDGVIGFRTAHALRLAGLGGLPVPEAAQALALATRGSHVR